MKGRVVCLEPFREGFAAALVVDGQLHDLYLDNETDAPHPGEIHRAVVDRPLKGLGGALLRLGEGQSGFLREAKGLRAGDSLLVQVNTFAEAGKAAPVSPRPLFKSRFAIVTPHAPGLNIARRIHDEDRRDTLTVLAKAGMDGSEMGLILRSAAEHADDEDILADISDMRALAEEVTQAPDTGPELLIAAPDAAQRAWMEWADPAPDQIAEGAGSFDDFGLWDQIADLSRADVQVSHDAWMSVEPTRALVAVDINTGADFSPAAGLKANIAAFRALGRQLRLRGLGGQIVLDIAPTPKKDRKQLESALKSALKADPVETSFVGWTPLGHIELQRKRERQPLSQVL